MAEVANFCNAFPNVDMAFEVRDSEDITAGDPVTLHVTLEREGEEDEDEPEGGWGRVREPRRFCLGGDGGLKLVVACAGGMPVVPLVWCDRFRHRP